MKYEGYQMLNDVLITYKGRLYIPNCDDLKKFIMDELHKIPYTGHLGYQKMIVRIFRNLGVSKIYLVYCVVR
jgi:hypothetical protein